MRAAMVVALFAPLFAGCGAASPDGGGGGAADSHCQSKTICAVVSVDQCCGSDCGVPMDVPCDAPVTTAPSPEQLARAKCMLEAGRDRTVGKYQVIVNLSAGGDGAPMTTTFVNFGDGFASTQLTSVPSTGAEQNPAVRHAFKPKSFFDACLALSDETKLFECTLGMTESASVPGPTCPP